MRKALTCFLVCACAPWTLGAAACSERTGARADMGTAAPIRPADRLDALVRDDLDAQLAFAPVTATWLGAHGQDDRLDDVRIDAISREAGRLKLLAERLRALDEAGLDEFRKTDRLLLLRRTEAALGEITELRPLERNPAHYVELAQAALLELVNAPVPAPPERLRAITARLWKIRPLFDEARRNLRAGGPGGVPEVLARRAVDLIASLKNFVIETLPRVVQVADQKAMEDFRAAAGDAVRAIDDFGAWLSRDLVPRAKGDFALGRERLMERLRLTEGIDATPELLLAVGERELADSRRRYDELKKVILAGKPGDPDKIIEEDHAKPDELLKEAQAGVNALTEFIALHKPLELSDKPPVVQPMPAALFSYVLLDAAGPLERPRDAVLFVEPVGKTWQERHRQEHLRILNRAQLQLATLHEVAGRWVLAERNRRAPTTTQKLALAGSFTGGFPHYIERALVDAGFGGGDPELRLLVERAIMTRAARLVAAVKLHALGAKLDDATKVFTEGADLDEYPARREAERAAADPWVMLDALGRVAIERLRDDWRAAHADATLGQFHAQLLAHGTPPVAVLRKILLPGDSRAPL